MNPVNLPVLKIDNRHLRFCLIDEDKCFYNSGGIHKRGCQPLFLGSDILHGCISEWDKNMSRIHARYAKQGLATKLYFKVMNFSVTDPVKEFMLVEKQLSTVECLDEQLQYSWPETGKSCVLLQCPRSFRAVFEYSSLSVQRQCLQHLTDVWMRAYQGESPPQLDAE